MGPRHGALDGEQGPWPRPGISAAPAVLEPRRYRAVPPAPQSNDGKSLRASVKMHDDGSERDVESPMDPDGGGARDVKLCNPGLSASGEAADATGSGTHGSSRSTGVENLINLTHLHEPAILHVISLRYAANLIYTYTGETAGSCPAPP